MTQHPDAALVERRCVICDWPLKERMEDGCIPGNCSYRPLDRSHEWDLLTHRRALVERMKAELISLGWESPAALSSRVEGLEEGRIQSARRERESMIAALRKSDAVLRECAEYFERRQDVRDGEFGQLPNEEMRLLTEIRQALGELPG